MAWIAVGGAAVSIVGGLIGGRKAKNAARNAKNEAKAMQVKIDSIKRSRASAINPYAGNTDLSSLASDLSSMVTNPFEQLGVATQAAEIQMEQSDIALANTLDTLRSTGAGAGGATALAQAALQSKKGISANIEMKKLELKERLQLISKKCPKLKGNKELQSQKDRDCNLMKLLGNNLGFRQMSLGSMPN